MYRQQIEVRTIDRANFALNNAALGDVISSLPAVIWARVNHHPDLKLVVWVHDGQVELVRYLLAPYGEFQAVMPLSQMDAAIKNKDQRFAGPFALNGLQHHVFTRNKCDMVDFAYATLLDRLPLNDNERSYPTEAPLGERPAAAPPSYVVFPVGATSGNKMFKAHVMGPIIRWCIEHGYTPVIVGAAKTHVHAADGKGNLTPLAVKQDYEQLPEDLRTQCLDMRDKTTLLELRDWLGHANAVVGMDGGTLHLAGTTLVPIVYGVTHLEPVHRGIVRNGERNWQVEHVRPRDLECAGCQSNFTLMFRHDFRFCIYGDTKCVDQLASEDFIAALKTLGL